LAADKGVEGQPEAIEETLVVRAGHPCQLRVIDGPIPS
jgi:hypothetical protein